MSQCVSCLSIVCMLKGEDAGPLKRLCYSPQPPGGTLPEPQHKEGLVSPARCAAVGVCLLPCAETCEVCERRLCVWRCVTEKEYGVCVCVCVCTRMYLNACVCERETECLSMLEMYVCWFICMSMPPCCSHCYGFGVLLKWKDSVKANGTSASSQLSPTHMCSVFPSLSSLHIHQTWSVCLLLFLSPLSNNTRHMIAILLNNNSCNICFILC